MKSLTVILFLLIDYISYSQITKQIGINDSSGLVQQFENPASRIKINSQQSSTVHWIPDTILVQAQVIRIIRKRHGYLIDLMDTHSGLYYKIVSWKIATAENNKIQKSKIYNLTLWEGAPKQIGDITFKPIYIENYGRKIKISYRTKNGIVLPTFYYSSDLKGLSLTIPDLSHPLNQD